MLPGFEIQNQGKMSLLAQGVLCFLGALEAAAIAATTADTAAATTTTITIAPVSGGARL